MKVFVWLKQNFKFVVTTLGLFVIGVITTWYLATRQVDSSKELKSVKTEVSNLMRLPADEEPTLATVADKTKLKDPFLVANAENGDRLLIYAKNQLVIIYRPKLKKVVTTGTVSIDPAMLEAKGTTLTVVDGSNNPDKTERIVDQVKVAFPDIKVTNGGKISRQDLPSTIVIDNTDEKDNLVNALVKVISGKRGVVPLDVELVATDLMIIVGTDQ